MKWFFVFVSLVCSTYTILLPNAVATIAPQKKSFLTAPQYTLGEKDEIDVHIRLVLFTDPESGICFLEVTPTITHNGVSTTHEAALMKADAAHCALNGSEWLIREGFLNRYTKVCSDVYGGTSAEGYPYILLVPSETSSCK